MFITTGGLKGDSRPLADLPIAVDGWACVTCGVFRYPRNDSVDTIHELTEQGVAHGQADRFAEAELCFARVVWNWPGYALGHGNDGSS